MNRTVPGVAAASTAIAVMLLLAPPSYAQSPSRTDHLALPDGPVTAKIEPSLLSASGTVTVSLELSAPSLAEAVGDDAKQDGADLSPQQQRAHVAELERTQEEVADRVADAGAEEVIATQVASNLLVVEVEAERLPELAADPEVERVLPVVDPELDLSETVPYIGASTLRRTGLTGAGVRVAVLDSGVDYTHASLGGPGTAAAYRAAYGDSVDDPANTTLDGLFPTAKVVGGYDFVGEFWPDGELAPDPDPIDCGPAAIPEPCAGGHGTNVADIIAGVDGVAPDATVYAYKVCSAVATSCSGVAMLQAFEAALDPNGDGDVSDAVDIINLSLGAPYGVAEDAHSAAAANAVRMGVTVVASAGNSSDRPYATGSPASAPEVLSVAQTHVPSALHYNLSVTEPAAAAGVFSNTNSVGWAPITDGFAGEIAYGATEAERLGCFVDAAGQPIADTAGVSPYPPGFFEGKVALVDRGLCAISFKVHLAAEAGAVGVVVANNVAGLAPSFSFGGPDPFTERQTIVVGLEVGNALRGYLGEGSPVRVAVDAADATPLVGSMVATSSRGPNNSEVAIKPEIGAPGASLSAAAGSGDGNRVFGGTSGAAPMVAGAAALLLQAYPERSPLEIKSVLMNTADAEIYIQPAIQPGQLAEISRIGAGEVRVDKAYASRTTAWSPADHSAALSFGYQSVSGPTVLTKSVTIHNYADRIRTYKLESSFRYRDDADSRAVRLTVPPLVVVGPGRSVTVPVLLTIDPTKLPEWQLDGGPGGNNGSLLKANEFDGFVTITGGGDRVHLPWHVLPHRVSSVVAPTTVKLNRHGEGTALLLNAATSGQVGSAEVFALTGTSPKLPPSQLPSPGDDFAVVDLAAVGVRVSDDALQFGITTHGARAHPNVPIEFQVLIDSDRDGEDDYLVFNRDLSYPNLDSGQNVVWVRDLGQSSAPPSAYYYTEANLNSSNIILTVPLAAVGLAEGDQFDFSVRGLDWYFANEVRDSIGAMTFTVGTPRYTAAETVEVPALRTAKLTVREVAGGDAASPSQTGLLLLWRDGKAGREASVITVQ